MRLAIALGLITTLFGAVGADGAPAMRSAATIGPEDMPHIEITSSDDSGVSLVFELPTLSVDEAIVGGERYQMVEIPGGALKGEVGHPALPAFTRLASIPNDSGVTLTYTIESVSEYPDFQIVPMQEDEGAPFVRDTAAYSIDAYGGGAPATVGSPAILRDLRVVPLTFNPIQFNPVTQTMKVADRVRVDITFEGQNLENVRRSDRRSIPPSFNRMYQELVVNYEGPRSGVSVEPGTYLLICPNDSGVISRLQPLLDWRERKGYKVQLVTTSVTGEFTDDIKSYIQSVYDSADPPLEYVALAGDARTPYRVRTWFEDVSGYDGEGDHPYTQLEGGDILADVHIGRLSFSDYGELETIVAKVVGYESTPYLSDPGWYTRACLTGDPYDSGYSTVIVQQWIKRRLRQIGYTEIDTIYSGSFVSQMRTALNRGDTIFSYRGIYNMSGWQNSNTYALTNGWKMPYVVTLTCDTGSFYWGTARSEAFLRAGSATSPKAGIGAIGLATPGTHTRYNNCLHYGIYRGLIYEGTYNLGATLTRGKMEMYLNYQDNEPNIVTIWSHWGNLMGDPAVDCWTGYPDPLTVDYPSTIPVGANSVVVTVNEEGGGPCADAQVCLMKGTETHSVGYTDAQGVIELPVSAISEGEMLITVTKHNRHPHLASIPVVGEARYVGYFSSSVSDDNGGGSSGNDDGIVNPGETIELIVMLKNSGTQTASDVQATLTTDDPYVTIIDAEESYGSISAGATVGPGDDFDFTVDLGCPHGHDIRLALDITSVADEWHSLIDLSVISADLQANGNHTLYNVGGNGIIDPGETGELSIVLTNTGDAAGDNPSATLFSLSEYATVLDAQGSYSTIGAGGFGENTSDRFEIEIAPECYEGYEALFKLHLEFSGGARDTTYVTIPVGQRSTNDPSGPDVYGYYAFDNTDTSYPEAPTYNWIEIDPNFGGNGEILVNLHDYGDYQDDSQVVDLPFPFQYYGQTYTKATICTNGWVCMGSTWTAEYRNWTIPGAGGPEAMIAAFWDDLWQVQYDNSDVYQYYDEANNRWIVEWSRMRNDVGNYEETFQAILFDPAHHPTETGDGEILFQYHTVANPDGVDGYATVGIENQDQSVGLLYTYYNDYTPGSTPLSAGRAIKFVPKREVLVGMIQGTVSNTTAGGSPIGGATVTVIESENEYQTDPDGTYEATELAGIYTVFASHEGFEPDTASSVTVSPGGSTVIDFDLIDIAPPSIITTLAETTNDSLGPYPVSASIKDSSPLADKTLYYRVNGGGFNALVMSSIGHDNYEAEIPGQSWSSKVEYYISASDVGDNTATDPPLAPSELHVFYVAPTIDLFTDAMELHKGWSVGAPDDDATGGIWTRVDPNGTFDGEEPVQPEDDHTEDPGVKCWVTGNAAPGSDQNVEDVDNGKTTLTSPNLYLAVEGVVVLRYYRWFTNDTGETADGDRWIVQISNDDGETWIDLENTDVSERSWQLKEYDLSDYITFTDRVRIRFVAEDVGYFSTVEAAVDDVQILFTGMYQDPSDVPEQVITSFGLCQNEPNPFNPRTTIRFSISSEAPTSLIIFDVQGRVMRRLLDGEIHPAGSHSVVWDGRDDLGRPVPSGIYLYHLASGKRAQTRKMILLQ